MGRYYDDKISLAGLDPANAFFQALQNAADAVDRAESDWYQRRKDVFDELDFGDFNKTDGQVEAKYASLKSDLSVYDFKTEFDRVNPSRRTGSNVYRFVHDTFTTSGIADGFSDERFVQFEDDDGDTFYRVGAVLRYHVDRGKGSVDTLYDDLSAFRTSTKSDTDFYEFIDDDEPGYFSVNDVFKGFGQVPLAWNSKSGYSSQQLQVMNAAGNDYDQQVGPVISAYNTVLSNYNGAGGGPIGDSSFTYKGVKAGEFVIGVEYQIKEPGDTTFTAVGAANNLAGTRFIATGAGSGTGIATAAMFPYQDFVGADNSYNRPQNLPAALINEARGFGS